MTAPRQKIDLDLGQPLRHRLAHRIRLRVSESLAALVVLEAVANNRLHIFKFERTKARIASLFITTGCRMALSLADELRDESRNELQEFCNRIGQPDAVSEGDTK